MGVLANIRAGSAGPLAKIRGLSVHVRAKFRATPLRTSCQRSRTSVNAMASPRPENLLAGFGPSQSAELDESIGATGAL